jgi:hypothetical protein
MKLRITLWAALATLMALVARPGAGFAQTPPNVMDTTVWAGPYAKYINGPFAAVRVCRAGTTDCQRVGGLLLDTGSFGLRIFRQALHITLDSETTGAETVAECTPFGSFTAWGRVALADVRMGGEPKILDLPIQIINPKFPTLPTSCKGFGTPIARSPQQMGFNGILGVGLLANDCPACVAETPGIYFACTGAGCSAITLAASDQVQNPVAHLPLDNNGVIIKFPAIPLSGASWVTGKLTFGIDTETNNQLDLSKKKVYQTDGWLNITTSYNSHTKPGFIDSGSNGLFFTSAIPRCGTTSPFYCPPALVGLTVRNTGVNATSGLVTVNIANAIALLNTGNIAFNDLGASLPTYFDFGLPFFFGRKVYVGMKDGSPSPIGGAPYWAY